MLMFSDLSGARVYHTRQDPRCRKCKDDPDTVQHITAECEMQARTAYMKHNNHRWHEEEEHLCQVWAGGPTVKMEDTSKGC